jgi:hypothetical protein
MKESFLVLGQIFISGLCYCQENFIPTKPDHISESEFRRGELILKNSQQQLADNNYKVTAHDYWNFAMAYSIMGQPKELIYNFLFKSKYIDKTDFCEIVKSYHQIKKGIDSTGFYKLLGQDYKLLIQDCSEMISNESFNIEEYISKNKYDKQLVLKLNDLLAKDQKFRSNFDERNSIQQRSVDNENIKEVESIIETFGYPGKSLVGSKFDFVIWIVIQHADLYYQEKYLPTIVTAVEKGELNKTTLKMLLDRINYKKTGEQIFGSQIGVPFADDKTIEAVKLKYKL